MTQIVESLKLLESLAESNIKVQREPRYELEKGARASSSISTCSPSDAPECYLYHWVRIHIHSNTNAVPDDGSHDPNWREGSIARGAQLLTIIHSVWTIHCRHSYSTCDWATIHFCYCLHFPPQPLILSPACAI